MSTHPRTDDFIARWNKWREAPNTTDEPPKPESAPEFMRDLESQLTTALARVAALEKESQKRWEDACRFAEKCQKYRDEIASLTRQLSESQESLRLSQHDAAQERLRIAKLEGLLSESQVRIGALTCDSHNLKTAEEECARLSKELSESQAQLAKAESQRDSFIRQLHASEAQLTSAREDVLRMDKAEELCSEFNCTSDATDFFLILPKSRDNEHGPKIFNPTLRSAIDAARGYLAETREA